MHRYHDHIVSAFQRERSTLVSRRSLLSGSVKGGAGLAIALSLGVSPLRSNIRGTLAQEMMFESDVDVLNYALTLEHLEYAFYRDGIGQFTFGADPFGNSIDDYLAAIRDHEGAHVDTLTQVIEELGGAPVEEARYDFGYGSDPAAFLLTAAALENTGVSAYDGAGKFIQNADLLTAAGSIVAVEARHAAYLNLINGESPFPDGFETVKSPSEILEIAGPFIVS